MTLELQLLLACARVRPSQTDAAAVRKILDGTIDWTVFARKALEHGLAEIAGHGLARTAPDRVPAEILDALRGVLDRARQRNQLLFDELARLIEALAKAGIAAIPFKGPVLALYAYGDIGLRVFSDFDFLVHDADMAATVAILLDMGYERKDALSNAQIELIQRLQGQEVLSHKTLGIGVEPHTRLTPIKMTLDIDYAGLWRRAQRTDLSGRTMLTLAPEDDFLMLAIHGGKEMWWNIKWTCDVGAFLGAYPKLDWAAIAERARAQGCLRMVLLAVSLARKYFGAAIPDFIVAAESSDPAVAAMAGRIVAHWQSGEPLGPPSHKTLSMDRLRLHDGALRRARYVMRTWFLPGPHHVVAMPLPKGLDFLYVPIKIGHDVIALPLWRAYRQVLAQAGRLRESLMTSDLALALTPGSAEEKSNIKRHQRRYVNAERALAVSPDNVQMLFQLGNALSGLKRYEQAIASYDKALLLEPDQSAVWVKRRAAAAALGQKTNLPDFARDPQDADGWTVKAAALWFVSRYADAIEASDRALALAPENSVAMRLGIQSRLFACDWRRREDDQRRIVDSLRVEQPIIVPFFHRVFFDSEAENLLHAQLVAKGYRGPETPLWRGEPYRHDKIRIAYVSTDFRDHVVADAIAGVFEHHDKTRFEMTAISLGPNDASEMRRRLESVFDRFLDVQDMSDGEVAKTIRALEIDIVIDLNGYSGVKRTGIFALRPAPIQVNYLGYPGTMGAPFIDYIIADQVTIPEENRIHYTEQVVYLPHSYMPNDSKRPIAERTPSRSEAGLPDTGFIFTCHNVSLKIAPEIFDVWMRLLHKVEGSVIWLRSTNDTANANLQREAAARGVAPERLIFAPRVPQTEDHLARLRLADLFLDTIPYNAHATACDALWAGLPVLTCAGGAFPARVAASVLHAVGLPELVTQSLAEYEQLALALARDPERLAGIRAKLLRNRGTEPLFDTARFTRDLESAYSSMWGRQHAGLPPAGFTVAS